jgi:hypothetical protein
MAFSFNNSTEVFIFIILCSVYVCSVLWIYGDAATRDMGLKGLILPFIFILALVLTFISGFIQSMTGLELGYWPLVVWPIGYIAWFGLRPKHSHAITE